MADKFAIKTRNDPFLDYDWSSYWSNLDFDARKEAICTPITQIHRKIDNISAWIWIMPRSCEQGLPHTRSVDIIAIPENINKSHLPSIIDHEKIHLLQRRMPDSWSKFYRIKWDYETFEGIPAGMPKDLVLLRRANPDTARDPWVRWRNRWWSVPTYKSKNELSLAKSIIQWWDEKNNTISTDAPEEWISFFGSDVQQSEHPHELSAEFLSGPLRRGAFPTGATEGMIRLRNSWSDTMEFPALTIE